MLLSLTSVFVGFKLRLAVPTRPGFLVIVSFFGLRQNRWCSDSKPTPPLQRRSCQAPHVQRQQATQRPSNAKENGPEDTAGDRLALLAVGEIQKLPQRLVASSEALPQRLCASDKPQASEPGTQNPMRFGTKIHVLAHMLYSPSSSPVKPDEGRTKMADRGFGRCSILHRRASESFTPCKTKQGSDLKVSVCVCVYIYISPAFQGPLTEIRCGLAKTLLSASIVGRGRVPRKAWILFKIHPTDQRSATIHRCVGFVRTWTGKVKGAFPQPPLWKSRPDQAGSKEPFSQNWGPLRVGGFLLVSLENHIQPSKKVVKIESSKCAWQPRPHLLKFALLGERTWSAPSLCSFCKLCVPLSSACGVSEAGSFPHVGNQHAHNVGLPTV